MKRIKNFIKQMTLMQQLLLIVVSISIFLITFFFGFLSINIDFFVEQQMFSVIHNAQDGVIENYLLGKSGSSLFGSSNANMVHIIAIKDKVSLISMDVDVSGMVSNIDERMSDILTKGPLTQRLDERFEKKGLLSMSSINEDTLIATIMPIEFHNEFKSVLLNSFVNMIVLVIGIVLLILLLWVGTLIHPLNLIKEYIEKTKKGEEATLHIDRGDEIGELANVLLDMQDELKRQEALKEEMLQNISHDLKTPVATIKSYSEAIKDGIYPYETLEKSVDVIIEHAERLEKKVFNLLMLNRMDYMTHQEIESYQKINLASILEQVIVSVYQIRPEIEIVVHGSQGVFTGHEEPWRVVIENLLDNAIRYAKTRVEINLDDDYLSFYNDGTQVTEKQLKHFFKPYEMGEKGQFGLGLAIVHRVITNYNYRIEVENKDEGVLFIITRKD